MFVNHDPDDKIGGGYKWSYQRKVLEASCADINSDSKNVLTEKIQSMWAEYERTKGYYCNSIRFDVPRGNIIKYAVNNGFDQFLYDMIEWKIDLNKVDETDKRTVLDYVEYQIGRNKGNALESRHRGYYDLLRKAGAKHARELE